MWSTLLGERWPQGTVEERVGRKGRGTGAMLPRPFSEPQNYGCRTSSMM
jgi:hypothetical protein